MSDVGRDQVLPSLLSADHERSRDEPEIAANIGAQLEHMGLSTWSISVLRRLRDAIGRQAPRRVLEVGGSIGHRSAWLFDLFNDNPIDRFDIVEQGAKFGVILHRLQSRYEAAQWSSIIVNDFATLCAEEKAWKLTTTSGVGADERRLSEQYDAIIIDSPLSRLSSDLVNGMELLSSNGVLYTTEPETPVGDYEELDDDGKAKVDGFNSWIEFIQSVQTTHYIAFVPLFSGTLVAFFKR
jgi:predicted O-methyltransferase YrrM